MPGPNTYPVGNLLNTWVLQVTLTPASVTNSTFVEQTFTVKGLKTTDTISVTKAAQQNGLILIGSRVSAADTLALTYYSISGSITPTAAEVYTVEVNRADPGESMAQIV